MEIPKSTTSKFLSLVAPCRMRLKSGALGDDRAAYSRFTVEGRIEFGRADKVPFCALSTLDWSD